MRVFYNQLRLLGAIILLGIMIHLDSRKMLVTTYDYPKLLVFILRVAINIFFTLIFSVSFFLPGYFDFSFCMGKEELEREAPVVFFAGHTISL
jgi:hypothetical protein